MKTDALKQYITLRQSLFRERDVLEKRLEEIKSVLNGDSSKPALKGARPARLRNPLSLRKAVIQVTTGKPSTKQEILEAVKRLGYRFTAENPTNSLNVILYSKKAFKNNGGKFSPAK